MASWLEREYERNEDGTYTPLAMALQALGDNGCDCGTDEPGSCLGCLCEAALRKVVAELEAMRAESATLRAELAARRAIDEWIQAGSFRRVVQNTTCLHASDGDMDGNRFGFATAPTYPALCVALGIEVTDD
jgi:hypothetical protein